MRALWNVRTASAHAAAPRIRRALSQVMRWDPALSDDLAERLWDDPERVLALGTILQAKPRCTVVKLDGACGKFVLKRHRWGSFGRMLRRSFHQSTAEKCWLDGRFLHASGIPTQRPWASIDRRFGPLKYCSYVLTDYIPGTSLYRFLRYEKPGEEQIRELARQVAQIWQRLDTLRVQHNDFKTENFLIDPSGKLWLIDLERMRRCRSVSQTRTRQTRDLVALFHPRNWRANPAAAEIFRQEFLRLPAIQQSLATAGRECHLLSLPFSTLNRSSQLVTVLIPTLNAAGTILNCLGSVRDVADEILVVDGGSRDGTLNLVREFGGCRTIKHPGKSLTDLVAVGSERARHEWILHLNPDEQCNPELSKHIQDVIAREPTQDGFRIQRVTCFRGHRLRFGDVKREWSVRLFRRDAIRYEFQDGQAQLVIPSAKIGRLAFAIEYESCRSMHESLAEQLHNAALSAEDASLLPQSPRIGRLLGSAPWQFFKSYILRGGLFDGWAGLHASALTALSVYFTEAMLWDKRQCESSHVAMSDEITPAIGDAEGRRAA
jgi:hypothetical protein